jgi:hypothetical protein
MSTLLLKFPRRCRGPIRVEHAEGDWLVIHGSQGWPYSSREAALQEAVAIADQIGAAVVVPSHGYGGRAPC